MYSHRYTYKHVMIYQCMNAFLTDTPIKHVVDLPVYECIIVLLFSVFV